MDPNRMRVMIVEMSDAMLHAVLFFCGESQ